jgi:hypothetical protein
MPDPTPEWMQGLTFDIGRHTFDVMVALDGTIFIDSKVLTDDEFEEAREAEDVRWLEGEDGQYYLDLAWIEREHPHYGMWCNMVRRTVADVTAAEGHA